MLKGGANYVRMWAIYVTHGHKHTFIIIVFSMCSPACQHMFAQRTCTPGPSARVFVSACEQPWSHARGDGGLADVDAVQTSLFKVAS